MKHLAWNLILVLIAAVLLSFDYVVTNEEQNVIVATCNTSIAYDKSADMYCLDTERKTQKVVQK